MKQLNLVSLIVALAVTMGCKVTAGPEDDSGIDGGRSDGGGATDGGGGGTDSGPTSCRPGPGESVSAITGGNWGGERFSPNSEELAVVVFDGFTPAGIRITDLCGDTVTDIPLSDGTRTYIAWSPDAATLYYVNSDGAASVPAAGGSATPIVADAGQLDVSPDGTMLVYADGSDLFTYDLAGATPTDLMQTGRFPRFSPDGTEIAFVDGDMLRVLTLADSMVRDIVMIDSAAFQPFDYFSDGSFAVVTSAGIDTVSADGTMTQNILPASAAQDIDVSPDDSLIAYRINGINEPVRLFGVP
jgi:Tol biopolymer transport system component